MRTMTLCHSEIGHTRIGGQWQRLVRGGHAVHVVRLAAGGVAAVEARTIPGGDAALEVAIGARQHGVALPEHIVEGRVAVGAARFGAWHGIGYGADVSRWRGTLAGAGGGAGGAGRGA